MLSDCISFKETGYFSNLICDYLEEEKKLTPFYNRFPKRENFQAQIKEKQLSFSNENRRVLFESLQNQYKNSDVTQETQANIELLQKDNTFTITTGHQLNLFTGPLYFLYKILSTINLTEELKTTYSSYDFVPVYWMATEDHDFLEINYFLLHGKKITWNKKEGLENNNGYVGEYDTKGLDEVFEIFSAELGESKKAMFLKDLFQKAYLKHNNLADATRYIVNALFGEYGVVVIDGNDTDLKRLFLPVVEKELSEDISFETVLKTTKSLQELGYKAQVNPREINLFYGVDGVRERIVNNKDGSFKVNNTEVIWSSLKELLLETKKYPERFSPNVILRPVYQEVILPNLCYIGGGGELAYWFQLKDNFKQLQLTFPILLLRNSVLLVSQKQQQKLKKLSVSVSELFMKQYELINYKVRQSSNIEIDFSEQKKELEKQFTVLQDLAKQTDKSFEGAVKAQKAKQLKGLETLEKRLLKAQRIKLSDQVARLVVIQNELFPQHSLQERKQNFSEFYLEYGSGLISELKNKLKPLNGNFTILNF